MNCVSHDPAVHKKRAASPLISPAGPCYLSLIDANDQGTPLHVYRLTLREDN